MSAVFSDGHLISSTGRKLSRLLTARFQAAGLTSEQWGVLHVLCLEDGITQRTLSDRTDKDPTNLTRILDQLERRGLVRREAHATDRRSYLLRVTDEGRSADRALTPEETRLVSELFEGVPEEQLEAFRTVMRIVNANADRIGKQN